MPTLPFNSCYHVVISVAPIRFIFLHKTRGECWCRSSSHPNPLQLIHAFPRKAEHPHASGNVIEEVWILARLDWKQSSRQGSNRVSSQNARRKSRAAANRDADLRSRSWRQGISCHVRFPRRSRRWPVSPRSDLPHAQQVLTSRLNLARCESDSSGSHCLIRMCTDSSYPIPVFRGSQVLPLICRPVNQGSSEDCCWDMGSLAAGWDIFIYLFSLIQ